MDKEVKNNGLTDGRLHLLIKAGETVLSGVDPQGLLSNASVQILSIGRNNAGIPTDWTLTLSFMESNQIVLSGVISPDGRSYVTSLRYNNAKGSAAIPLKPSETLSDALGNLSELPVPLKRLLASPGVSVSNKRVYIMSEILRLAEDALFFGIEGGGAEEGKRDYFSLFTCAKTVTEGTIHLVAEHRFEEGRIVVECTVDVFGLSKKKIRFDRSLGMGYSVSCDCRRTRDGKTKPSLILAFDLAGKIGGMYTKQRKKKIGIGKPKAK